MKLTQIKDLPEMLIGRIQHLFKILVPLTSYEKEMLQFYLVLINGLDFYCLIGRKE